MKKVGVFETQCIGLGHYFTVFIKNHLHVRLLKHFHHTFTILSPYLVKLFIFDIIPVSYTHLTLPTNREV